MSGVGKAVTEATAVSTIMGSLNKIIKLAQGVEAHADALNAEMFGTPIDYPDNPPDAPLNFLGYFGSVQDKLKGIEKSLERTLQTHKKMAIHTESEPEKPRPETM